MQLPTSALVPGAVSCHMQARRQCLLSRHSMLAAPRGRLVSAPCAAGTVPQTAAVVGSPGRSTAPRVLLADAGPTPDPKRDPSSQDPSKSDLGPHGPKLLPRPRRPQLDRIGGPGGPPGGGGPGSGGTQRVIANLVAYTGIVGTTAIVLAGFAGIDVWESFRWTNTNDLALAAALSVPLQAANAALLLPSFSALKLPHLADLKTMEANLKYDKEQREAAARAAEAEAAGAATAPEAPAAAAAVNAATAAAPEAAVASTSAATASPDAGAASASPSTPGAPQAAAPGPAPAPQAGAPPAPLPLPLPPGGLVPASSWGAGGGGPGGSGPDVDRAVVLGVDVTALRDALHLAQGHIISNNPTARINAGLEAAFAAVDTAAGEMLYRGVALTWLAAWLEDRIYEAGAEEALTQQLPAALAAALGPAAAGAAERLGVYGDAEVAVAAALVAYSAWSVMARNRREVARLEVLMDAVGRGMTKASAKNALNGDSAKRGGGGAVATTVVMGPGAIPIAASTAGGPLNGGGAGGGGGPPGKAAALEVMTRGAAVRAARDALQVATINAVFIATGGNLAASYAAALANQLLISAWQRLGAQRMQQRSSALAKELKAYNAEMQRILAKYTHKLPPAARTQLAAMDAAAPASSNSSSSSSSQGGEAAAAVAAAAAAAAAASTGPTSLGSVASEAPAGGDSASGLGSSSSTSTSSTTSTSSSSGNAGAPAAPGVSGGDGGKLQGALSALSFLVPEPEPAPRKAPAAASAASAAAAAGGSGAGGAHEKS